MKLSAVMQKNILAFTLVFSLATPSLLAQDDSYQEEYDVTLASSSEEDFAEEASQEEDSLPEEKEEAPKPAKNTYQNQKAKEKQDLKKREREELARTQERIAERKRASAAKARADKLKQMMIYGGAAVVSVVALCLWITSDSKKSDPANP